jgi:hypothetical protein
MAVLAFDIGIKNLAFAVLDASKNCLALENYDLLSDLKVAPTLCSSCKSNASYQCSLGAFCKRHVPKSHPIQEEISTLPTIKAFLKSKGLKPLSGKEKLLEQLKGVVAIPLRKPKIVRAAAQSLTALHDFLRRFVQEKWELFKDCSAVLLENQPAFKNPHMKSVQVLLFAVLREWFLRTASTAATASVNTIPEFHLVHAKKKVAAEAGDAGYAARKRGSEERVETLFTSGQVKGDPFLEQFRAAKKRSDMADALCMCVDFLEPK